MTSRKPYWVYFLFRGNVIIYIGMTADLKTRIAAHKNKKFNSVAVDKFKNKIDALNHERWSIIKTRPKYNWIPKHIIETHGILNKKRLQNAVR